MTASSKKTRAERRAADPEVQERARQHERNRQLQDERTARDIRRAHDATMLNQARIIAALIHRSGGNA